MINLTEDQTNNFLNLAKELHNTNWGRWTDASLWPDFGTPYTAFQQDAGGGQHVTIFKFDAIVKPFGYRGASRKWAAGPGGRRMKDVMGLGF